MFKGIASYAQSLFTELPPQAQSPAGDPFDPGESINVATAQDRLLELFERKQGPVEIAQTLASALNGDLRLFHLLCIAMMDSWPKLQRNIAEVARGAATAPWNVFPYCEDGAKPTAKADKFAKDVKSMVWGMVPRTVRNEKGFEDMIESLAIGFFFGHEVQETRWERKKDGSWAPRATKSLSARYYGYPYLGIDSADPEDRLMLDPSGGISGAQNLIDFPEHRFLVGINSGHPGHPSMASPLRALTAYWVAAVFGLEWFMSFTQLYGVPWRHVKMPKGNGRDPVRRAMQAFGSKGYIITDPDAKIEILDSSKSGSSLPQAELIKLADNQCDLFILGANLANGTDKNGSRALGEVHQETTSKTVDAVTDWVGRILTHQLIPAISFHNWGEVREDLPQIWAKREKPKDEKAKAERMEAIKRLGLDVGKEWGYEDLGIPIPGPDEELLFKSVEATPPASPPAGGKQPPKPPEKIAASEAGGPDTQKLFDQMEETLRTGSVMDWKAIAMMMAVGFAEGAGESGKETADA